MIRRDFFSLLTMAGVAGLSPVPALAFTDPLYHAGDWHGTNHCRESWGTILNEAKIDLLISGHTYVYGIHPPVKGQHNYPVVIGGGPQDGKRTIITVHADRKRLNLEMLDDLGRQVGQLTI